MNELERVEIENQMLRTISGVTELVTMQTVNGGYTFVTLKDFVVFMSHLEKDIVNNEAVIVNNI